MNYFTGGSHFSDEGVIHDKLRPYKSSSEMNTQIINRWNYQAKRGDTIYHLGNFITYPDIQIRHSVSYWYDGLRAVQSILAGVVMITGEQENRFIAQEFGNDFESFRDYCRHLGFVDVRRRVKLEIPDLGSITLGGYDKTDKESVQFIAETGRRNFNPNAIELSCDNNNFNLYSENDLVKKFCRRKG